MKSKWIASLSNGETIDELKNPVGDPKRSPFLNLVDYIKEKKLQIRHIKIIVNSIEYNSPTVGSVGRFSSLGVRGLWVARRQIFIYGSNFPEESYIDFSYSDGAFRHHLIINENSNQSWQSTSPLDSGTNLFIKEYCGDDY